MNKKIIDDLNILAKYYKKTGDKFRNLAYQKAATAIKGYDREITDISQVKGIKGVGPRIRDKVKEFLDTGHINKADEAREELFETGEQNERDRVFTLFNNIWGVGPAKAQQLWDAGFRSLEQLRKDKRLLTTNQCIGLNYYDHLLLPLEREYIDTINIVVRYFLTIAYGRKSFRMEVAGSYRRGQPKSGDVDILLTSTVFGLKDAVRTLQEAGVVTDVLSMRDTKFMGIATCPGDRSKYFRMDIEFLPEDEWGSGILYFTGSRAFNISMREKAKKLGYKLNESGLYRLRDGQRVPAYSEQDIFDVLKMPYVPPNRR